MDVADSSQQLTRPVWSLIIVKNSPWAGCRESEIILAVKLIRKMFESKFCYYLWLQGSSI